MWETNFAQGMFQMLPFTETATRIVNRDILKEYHLESSYLEILQQRFESNFPDLNIFKYDWVRKPINQSALNNAIKLILKAQEQFAQICMTARCNFISSSSQIKTKSRSQLKSVENELKVCLISIRPDIKTICAQKQAHVSH